MKAFFHRYSYDSVRLFLNQIAISMFGFALAMAAVRTKNDTLLLITSVAAIVFYLLLTYNTAWRCGSQDHQSIHYGKIKFNPLTGLWVALVANSVNLLLGLLKAIGTLAHIENLDLVPRFIALLIQGMYQGILAVMKVGGEPLNEYWLSYLLIPVPAILVAMIGYIAGAKDFHIIRPGMQDLPASDRPTKAELKEQKQSKKDENK